MRAWDHTGQQLADIQAGIFAASLDYSVSSPIFMRRYMNSAYCRSMDQEGYLLSGEDYTHVFDSLDQQYGESSYGRQKYTASELTWMGYLYRYWAYVYERPSRQIYQVISARELRGLFEAYHTLDPGQAVERILEAKGIGVPSDAPEERITQGVAILRRIRRQEAMVSRVAEAGTTMK